MERRTLLKAGLVVPAAAVPPRRWPRHRRTPGPAGRRHARDRPRLPLGRRVPARRQRAGRRAEQRPRARASGPAAGATVAAVVPGVDNAGGEGGLLGRRGLHPTFAATAGSTSSSPPRATTASCGCGTPTAGSSARRSRSSPASRAAASHNGGGLAFGGGASLFASTGDATEQRSRPRTGTRWPARSSGSTPTAPRSAGNPFGNRCGPTATATPRASPSAPTGRLWASEFGREHLRRAEPDRAGRATTAGRGVEGSDGAGGYRDPLVQWHPDRLLAERRRDVCAAAPGSARCAASACGRCDSTAAGGAGRPATSTGRSAGSAPSAGPRTARCGSTHEQRRRHRQGPAGRRSLSVRDRSRESAGRPAGSQST